MSAIARREVADRRVFPAIAIVAVTVLASIVIAGALPRRDVAGAPLTVAGIQYPQSLQNLTPPATRLAVDGDDLYFAGIRSDGNNHLYRYRGATDELTALALPSDPGGGWFVGIAPDGTGSVWVGWDHTLVRVNLVAQQVERFPLPPSAHVVAGVQGDWIRDVAFADGAVWITRNNASALLRLEPASSSLSEIGLASFGVPDRIRANGTHLWITLARNAQQQSFTAIAVVDTVTRLPVIIPERASAIAIDPTGLPLLVGAGSLPRILDPVTGRQTRSYASPFASTGSDTASIATDGTLLLANRLSGQLAVLDPGGTSWRTFKPTTEFVQPLGVPGQTVTGLLEINPEFTDVVFGRDSTAWVANPSYTRILHLVLR